MIKMTQKQKRFCDEYLVSLNATQSAIKAGYSPKTAYKIGQENLIKPQIKSYISEKLDNEHKENIMKVDEVLSLISKIAKQDTEEEFVTVVGIGDGCSEIAKSTKKTSTKDQLKALELLCKYHKLFDKVDNGNEVIEVRIIDNEA